MPERPQRDPQVGDRQPHTIPTKDHPHQVVFFRGVVRALPEPEKGQIRTTPNFALAMLIVAVVGVVRGFRGLTKETLRPHERPSGETPEEILGPKGPGDLLETQVKTEGPKGSRTPCSKFLDW